MKYLISSASMPAYKYVSSHIPDIGMLIFPGKDWCRNTCDYACDNGVYAAWVKGRTWDEKMHQAYLRMLFKLTESHPPLWVLLPDVVADWKATLELAKLYLPYLRSHDHRLNVAIALQDGCDFEEALDLEPDWVFVAGSSEWKEANIAPACTFFHPQEIRVHVGRVNTRRRLMLCQSAGVDSVDGTTMNQFQNATVPLIRDTLLQPCLPLEGAGLNA